MKPAPSHAPPLAPALFAHPGAEPQTLVDVLDRLLDRGVVIQGDLTLSVAGVDLLFVGLRVIAGSVDAMENAREKRSKELAGARAAALAAGRGRCAAGPETRA